MTDRIELRGLHTYGYHGVFEEERQQGQDFIIDLVCWVDLRAPAASDNIADTINYGDLADMAAEIVGGKPQQLIETVGYIIARRAMNTYAQLAAIEVTIHKPNAPIAHVFSDVAVVIRQSRKAMRR